MEEDYAPALPAEVWLVIIKYLPSYLILTTIRSLSRWFMDLVDINYVYMSSIHVRTAAILANDFQWLDRYCSTKRITNSQLGCALLARTTQGVDWMLDHGYSSFFVMTLVGYSIELMEHLKRRDPTFIKQNEGRVKHMVFSADKITTLGDRSLLMWYLKELFVSPLDHRRMIADLIWAVGTKKHDVISAYLELFPEQASVLEPVILDQKCTTLEDQFRFLFLRNKVHNVDPEILGIYNLICNFDLNAFEVPIGEPRARVGCVLALHMRNDLAFQKIAVVNNVALCESHVALMVSNNRFDLFMWAIVHMVAEISLEVVEEYCLIAASMKCMEWIQWYSTCVHIFRPKWYMDTIAQGYFEGVYTLWDLCRGLIPPPSALYRKALAHGRYDVIEWMIMTAKVHMDCDEVTLFIAGCHFELLDLYESLVDQWKLPTIELIVNGQRSPAIVLYGITVPMWDFLEARQKIDKPVIIRDYASNLPQRTGGYMVYYGHISTLQKMQKYCHKQLEWIRF